MSGRTRVFLDCDTGIDDALTIAWLAAQPDVEIVGVGSVSGNVAADVGARNTLDLLAMAGLPDVPVAVGPHDPLAGPFHGGAPHVHGENGVGDIALPRAAAEPVTESAASLLVRCARERPGLRVLAVGPLTNLALALELEPDLPTLVPEVVIMGGSALAPGNVSAVAEANIFHDAVAAAAVFEAAWSVTMVGLDVTMLERFEPPHLEALAAATGALPRALAAMLRTYFAFYEDLLGSPSCALHDPLAAAVAVGAVGVRLAPAVPVVVDATDGPGRGQTIADLRGRFVGYPPKPGARHRVVLETEPGFADRLLADLLR